MCLKLNWKKLNEYFQFCRIRDILFNKITILFNKLSQRTEKKSSPLKLYIIINSNLELLKIKHLSSSFLMFFSFRNISQIVNLLHICAGVF